MEFKSVVRSEAELRELMGDPVAPPVVETPLSSLDQHGLTFVACSPLVLIASSDVDEAFFHCSKCMIRSHLWQPNRWSSLDGPPTLAGTTKDAASTPVPVDDIERPIKADEENRLY